MIQSMFPKSFQSPAKIKSTETVVITTPPFSLPNGSLHQKIPDIFLYLRRNLVGKKQSKGYSHS